MSVAAGPVSTPVAPTNSIYKAVNDYCFALSHDGFIQSNGAIVDSDSLSYSISVEPTALEAGLGVDGGLPTKITLLEHSSLFFANAFIDASATLDGAAVTVVAKSADALSFDAVYLPIAEGNLDFDLEIVFSINDRASYSAWFEGLSANRRPVFDLVLEVAT